MWMDDGNVVLGAVHELLVDDSVEGTATTATMTTRLFRCHKSVLAKHSSVFRDMFALAQVVATENYEGVPLVSLPDRAEDVKALLQVLYDPMYVLATYPFFAH